VAIRNKMVSLWRDLCHIKRGCPCGSTENAGRKNDGLSKSRGVEMQDMKMQDMKLQYKEVNAIKLSSACTTIGVLTMWLRFMAFTSLSGSLFTRAKLMRRTYKSGQSL